MRRRWALYVIPLAMLLAGCAETEFVAQTSKNATRGKGVKHFKVGDPYEVNGVVYEPRIDDEYDEEGYASWYGRKFHGRRTANGESFNMDGLTAAHRTLPMPSMVLVTNLENGRSLKLRVNDRGPFADGRIIDVSRRAAELLGFKNQGLAKVRVQVLADESKTVQGYEAEAADYRQTAAKAPPEPKETVDGTEVSSVVSSDASGNAWVQAGAFASYPRALYVRTQLSAIGPAEISTVSMGETDLYRVRVGPVASMEEAEDLRTSVVRAGYPASRVIVAN